ncbi:MAG: transketolase [Cytophagales bacterium]|nr:MAG: transketolase [Cytophagales bacterium]
MNTLETPIEFRLSREEVLHDYLIACESRQASILARKEVYMGKAKFGVFGTGKEIAQIAMAKYFQPGDFRAGYYRDQTFMMAIKELTLQQFFAQLYAHTNVEADPSSAGRLMVGHYGTRSLDKTGNWNDLTKIKNSSPDISPTGAQMPRLVGLAYASKLYRNNPDLAYLNQFSVNGNEVAFGTIGNGAVAEGVFFEAMNAAGVLQIPLICSIWDDGYAISVTQDFQTTKIDIAKNFEGIKRTAEERGIEILKVKGWDYEQLCRTYKKAAQLSRNEHVPVLLHVEDLTQPLGHSTSGSHERYKSKERLEWEENYDCNKKFKEWILENEISDSEELEKIEEKALENVKLARTLAWDAYLKDMQEDKLQALTLLESAASVSTHQGELILLKQQLERTLNPIRNDVIKAVKKALRILRHENDHIKSGLVEWVKKISQENNQRYSSHLYSESNESALKIPIVQATYTPESPWVDGREVIQKNFEALLEKDPRFVAFGEDVGIIGDVNQGFSGLQEKFGNLRVIDTGIREATIMGQGIGLAMRGLRPVAEIQYLDYLLFGLQTLSDDLASLHYRTAGGQKAPLIIRTRGHRLEGVWHSGSPIGMILGSLRGIYLLVPRNLTQAAGMYNTMMQSDDPALIIESLNAYRLKEQLPSNLGIFTVPLGVTEIIKEGEDITIVTYGSMCRIAQEAALQLEEIGITCEIIDVQTLIPFDIHHSISKSIKKTGRVIFADEDVSGGGTGFMMQQVLDLQNAFYYLDAPARTISAKDHRPAYGSDGDYFSKPNTEDFFDTVYEIMSEVNPKQYPNMYN